MRGWQNCTLASFEALQTAAAGDAQMFVWPDEGEFRGEVWLFNEAHEAEFEPLLIDRTSAAMMMALHDALSETNAARFREWVGKHRGNFGALWEFTQERVTLNGFRSS